MDLCILETQGRSLGKRHPGYEHDEIDSVRKEIHSVNR